MKFTLSDFSTSLALSKKALESSSNRHSLFPTSKNSDVLFFRLQSLLAMSVRRLREALQACSDSFESGDLAKSDESIAEVSGLLDSFADSPPLDSEDALAEIYQYLSSPDSNQMVVDVLSLELPKVVIKFAALSDKCQETVQNIINHLVSVCNPRDMLPILCEALGTHAEASESPISHILLLSGFSKVFLCIQRHHLEQVKVALPVIVGAINAVSSQFDEEGEDNLKELFGAAISIGTSIQAICQNLEGRRKEELCAVLGLYVLQNIALLSRSKQRHIVSSCGLFVVQYSQFLPFCGLSYCGLLTGDDLSVITDQISKVDGDDFMNFFSFASDGAPLAVIWGHILDDVAKAAGEQSSITLNKISNDRNKLWQAVGMLKSILSSVEYSWEIKSHGIELLLNMMDGTNLEESNTDSIDISPLLPSIFAALKGIERVIIGAPDASLRKKAFSVLKKVVSNLPCNERFDILKALMMNCNSPSMVAILIDLVREQILGASRQNSALGKDEMVQMQNDIASSPFWGPNVLDVVELVLRPPEGGPPSLPEYCEPVLSALNLYRFILILESRGGTNQTGVLSEKSLQRAYSEWLLPLRALTSRVQAENEKDGSEFASSILCGLSPVQLVLHRCIELVEEQLKVSK